jgi:hypothetical protein
MALGSVQLKLYVYQGTVGSYTEGNLAYTINKSKISGKSNIVLEIAELVRDYITIDFDNYASSTNSHAVWVTAIAYYKDTNGNDFTYGNPETFNYIATDGYGYFEDEINPELSRNALISSNHIYLPEGVAGKLPIFSEGVGKVTIDSSDTQITDNGHSNQKIQYVTIPADSDTIQIYDTDDSTLLKTITVTNICEPKYTAYKVTFANKYGALQDLYFFKKTTESFTVTDELYKRNIVDTDNVSYSLKDTQNQRYNVNAKTKLTLNTGFIHEDMNQTIEELFLTENAWINYEGNILPIIPLSKSLQFKTSLNNRLTDYTVDFEFGFNKINNIR